MKKINFLTESNFSVTNAPSKISASFVNQLTEAFRKFPPKVDMKYKQDATSRLIISLTVTYENGKQQHYEGAGDTDLISAILKAMGRNLSGLAEYKAEEHDVEVAQQDENMVFELFQQYLNSSMQCYIDTDWCSAMGKRYRKVRFTPSFNMNVKFCLEATPKVDGIINKATTPAWMEDETSTGQTENQPQKVA